MEKAPCSTSGMSREFCGVLGEGDAQEREIKGREKSESTKFPSQEIIGLNL